MTKEKFVKIIDEMYKKTMKEYLNALIYLVVFYLHLIKYI